MKSKRAMVVEMVGLDAGNHEDIPVHGFHEIDLRSWAMVWGRLEFRQFLRLHRARKIPIKSSRVFLFDAWLMLGHRGRAEIRNRIQDGSPQARIGLAILRTPDAKNERPARAAFSVDVFEPDDDVVSFARVSIRDLELCSSPAMGEA